MRKIHSVTQSVDPVEWQRKLEKKLKTKREGISKAQKNGRLSILCLRFLIIFQEGVEDILRNWFLFCYIIFTKDFTWNLR